MRSRFLIFLLLSAVFVNAGSCFEITAFCPDTWLSGEGDEYFVISGTGNGEKLLITDNEGSVRFPDGSYLSGSTVVAREAVAYYSVYGKNPDYEIIPTDKSVPDMIRIGNFRMANKADELVLLDDGRKIQEVVWPGAVISGEGRVHILSDGEWDLRVYYEGQSSFEPETFFDTAVTAFVSPDCSYEVLKSLISSSCESIRLNVYELTKSGIAYELSERSSAGVDVKVLLEGSPVGGVSDSEYAAVNVVQNSGGEVRMMLTENKGSHAPYRYDHAKYLVSDGESVLVASENFGETGFPQTGCNGNRGWGIVINDAGVSDYFDGVFAYDFSGGWSGSPGEDSGRFDETDSSGYYGGYNSVFTPQRFDGVTVTPVISPDTSYLIQDMISGAEESVDIEQAYIKNWSSGENPYLEEAIDAARRGASVRIILDSYYYNVDGDDDNDEMAAYINSVADAESLNLQARLARTGSGMPVKVHNKGVIVDSEKVLISSVNWNENSPQMNREAGIIAEGSGIAGYYGDVFSHDWEFAGGVGITPGKSSSDFFSPGSPGIAEMLFQKQNVALLLVALLVVLYAVRKRG
ncbi:phospholipase D-like domain-containing protein [Methanoplanus limicola]|uniref:Phospholipase D/transphosphatidylase n=1 Tax=Methanoplanus limicola DSM 2279 TaxID=937775 RepID=H1Z0K6_9EURY|nr:phospholipase D-like domain-containing protein [Methanoplanus limicola]EHQ35263.1 phospholipase D/transphosphatidylase [Methanoplanus limicola DSM 2279]